MIGLLVALRCKDLIAAEIPIYLGTYELAIEVMIALVLFR